MLDISFEVNNKMSLWQFLDGLIRNPPLWIISIIVALLVAHMLDKMYKILVSFSKKDDKLIEILELFVVVMLGTLTIKSFYLEGIEGDRASHEWYEHPLCMLVILLISTFASMVIYTNLRKVLSSKSTDEEAPRDEVST
jgi:hypothetical protein